MKELRGAGVALVTPFTEDGAVDVIALSHIVSHCINGGLDYLVVLGTTAESVTLTISEKRLVMDTVIAANAGELPLVLGVGGNNTMAVAEELRTLDVSGFCAILSVSPYYNRPTQEGIYQHFKTISKASSLPIIVYNVPGRTGSNMLPSTVIRLANDFENIVAVKEASGSMVQIMEIIASKPTEFMVISGDDITALPTILAGGDGVISVIGQGIPQEFSKMVGEGLSGNYREAYQIHYQIQKGMQMIFEEGNPAGIKSIMAHIGLCTDTVRLPLITASADLGNRLAGFLKSLSSVTVS